MCNWFSIYCKDFNDFELIDLDLTKITLFTNTNFEKLNTLLKLIWILTSIGVDVTKLIQEFKQSREVRYLHNKIIESSYKVSPEVITFLWSLIQEVINLVEIEIYKQILDKFRNYFDNKIFRKSKVSICHAECLYLDFENNLFYITFKYHMNKDKIKIRKFVDTYYIEIEDLLIIIDEYDLKNFENFISGFIYNFVTQLLSVTGILNNSILVNFIHKPENILDFISNCSSGTLIIFEKPCLNFNDFTHIVNELRSDLMYIFVIDNGEVDLFKNFLKLRKDLNISIYSIFEGSLVKIT